MTQSRARSAATPPRRATCLLVPAIALLAAAPAAAAEPPACALASVIGELTAGEEKALTQACSPRARRRR